MRITELHLYTQDLHAQRLFYTRTLGLPLVTETVAAPVAPVEVTIEGAEEQHYHVSPYPYEIDVVAKTSRS